MSTAVAEVATAPVVAQSCGVSIVLDDDQVTIPAWVRDLASFRRWTDTDDFPEKARICYLKGEVWIDMRKEQIFTHVAVKTEFTIVVGGMAKAGSLGMFLVDGAYVNNPTADIGVKPDAVFIATATLQAGRVRFVQGKKAGYLELEGSPDMVLEVVSESSVRKDKVRLHQAYWEAGVQEYWLVDARTDPPTFDILRYTSKGYTPTRKSGGWLKSAVFGKAFRLTQRTGVLGQPDYTLDVR